MNAVMSEKIERLEVRIAPEKKKDARALAKLLGFGERGVSTLVNHLITERVTRAIGEARDLYIDARKSLTDEKKPRKATKTPRTNQTVVRFKGKGDKAKKRKDQGNGE